MKFDNVQLFMMYLLGDFLYFCVFVLMIIDCGGDMG